MSEHVIGIVGAGPASLYAAEKLSKEGHVVVMFNRDIRHGGLAEYGIYLNKYKMKSGLRKVFQKILSHPGVHYFGDVTVGEGGDFTLDELRELGFSAVVVAVGAQGTKWQELPGERSVGVYHAKDVVYHYNGLPPFSERDFPVGPRACVVGLGNVALDIVHWLVCEKQIEEVTLVARRGPAERAYTDKEVKLVAGALDLAALEEEFGRVGMAMRQIGQEPEGYLAELRKQAESPLEVASPTRLKIRYLRSPAGVVVDESGVRGLECDVMGFEVQGEWVGVRKTGDREVIACETVVFAIGDAIEASIGLPLNEDGRTFAVMQEAWRPERARYRVRDPRTQQPYGNVFVVGWARKASDGLVGKARQDATQGCDEILAFLDGEFGDEVVARPAAEILARVQERLESLGKRVIRYADVVRLEAAEAEEAKHRGLPEFKYSSRMDMLRMMEGEA